MALSVERLAAEVLLENGERGSGFLISKGVVLTSLHVLLAGRPIENVEAGLRAKARFNGDLLDASAELGPLWDRRAAAKRLKEKGIVWHWGSLIWPTTRAIAEKFDIALLKLDDPDATRLTPLPLVRAHLPQDRSVGCIGTGYPQLGIEREGDEEIWECESISGNLLTAGRRLDGARRIRVTGGGTPEATDDWKGFSGAAIWVDDEPCTELIGVAQSRASGRKDNDEVRCWPLSVIDDVDFWRLSEIERPGSSAPPPPTAQPLESRLADSFFRFDRHRATMYLRNWLRGDAPGKPANLLRESQPTRPAIILLKGHAFDEPILCARRFAEILAEEAYPRRADAYRVPIQIPCGMADDPADLRLDTMFRLWAKAYAPPLHDLRPDFKEVLLAGLGARDRSRVVVVEHTDEHFGEECAKVIQGLVDMLAAWSPEDPKSPFPPVLLLSTVIGDSGGARDDGYKPLTLFADKEAKLDIALRSLRDATPRCGDRPLVDWYLDLPVLSKPAAAPGDITAWLEDITVRESFALPPGLHASIQQELRWLDEFPVRFARQAVIEGARKQGV
jgi:hypothetical protein